jgi:hypothetical protein
VANSLHQLAAGIYLIAGCALLLSAVVGLELPT